MPNRRKDVSRDFCATLHNKRPPVRSQITNHLSCVSMWISKSRLLLLSYTRRTARTPKAYTITCFQTATTCNYQTESHTVYTTLYSTKTNVTIGYISNIYYDVPTSLRDALLSADSVAHRKKNSRAVTLLIFIVGKYNKEVGMVTKPHNFH